MKNAAEAPIPRELEHRLTTYALAAGAVASGLLGGAASAEVVYTPVNVQTSRGSLNIDLDQDGVNDFILVDHVFLTGSRSFTGVRRLVVGGGPYASAIPKSGFAQVLHSGNNIGS